MYPIVLQFGPFGLRVLPVVWAVGIWAAVKLAASELRRRGLDPGWAQDFLTPAVIAGLVGARLYYVLVFDAGWFLAHPGDLLSLWSGLAYPGALLASWASALWFCRRRRIDFWRFADATVPGLILGQAISAVGSFLNGSGYGTATAVRWAVVFHDPRSQAPLGVPVHPAQLYETLALSLLLGALWTARRVRPAGALFLLYLAGLVMLAPLDVLKGDALWVFDSLPAAVVTSLAALLGAGVAWARGPRRVRAHVDRPDDTSDVHAGSSESAR